MLESDKILADVVTLVDGYRALEKRCKELESKAVSADKFYNWAVPIEQDTNGCDAPMIWATSSCVTSL